jgi:hypothetical protein
MTLLVKIINGSSGYRNSFMAEALDTMRIKIVNLTSKKIGSADKNSNYHFLNPTDKYRKPLQFYLGL